MFTHTIKTNLQYTARTGNKASTNVDVRVLERVLERVLVPGLFKCVIVPAASGGRRAANVYKLI